MTTIVYDGKTLAVDSQQSQWSGADVARGAYHICKDPIKALEVAIELDVYTGGQINTIEIQKPA